MSGWQEAVWEEEVLSSETPEGNTPEASATENKGLWLAVILNPGYSLDLPKLPS